MAEEILDANQRQIGGEHYRKVNAEYQHWDLVADSAMGYFEGQVTKYVARWRGKNGLQDVDKALHYCEKLIQLVGCARQPVAVAPPLRAWRALGKFTALHQLSNREIIIFELCISRQNEQDLYRLRAQILALRQEVVGS